MVLGAPGTRVFEITFRMSHLPALRNKPPRGPGLTLPSTCVAAGVESRDAGKGGELTQWFCDV